MVTAFAARVAQDAITTRAHTAVLGDAAVRLLDEAVDPAVAAVLGPAPGRRGSTIGAQRPSLVVELGPAHAC
jgi:hypothetical protein